MNRTLALVSFLIYALTISAQNPSSKWSGSIAQQKVFIENKSQFDSKNKQAGGQILFGTDEGPSMIYFHQNRANL